jgi:hypothetical protein
MQQDAEIHNMIKQCFLLSVITSEMCDEKLETTITNQNLIKEEIKCRLNSGNACYHSIQNSLLYKNANIEIKKNYNFACDFGEERRRKEFQNGLLRRMYGSKRDEMRVGWRKLHNEELRDLYTYSSA